MHLEWKKRVKRIKAWEKQQQDNLDKFKQQCEEEIKELLKAHGEKI